MGALGWQLLDDDPEVVAAALLDALASRRRRGSSSAARSRTPPRCASRASTCRTTTATGTRCTTRSRPRTGSTRRCNAPTVDRAPAGRGARGAPHQPRPLPQRARGAPAAHDERQPRRARALLRRAGHGRRSRERGVRLLAQAAARAPSSSPRSGTRCSPKTPSSTGTRCSRPGVRQSQQWPEGSEEEALVLTAVARFLAAHTPTRRELPTVVRIATLAERRSALRRRDGGSAFQPAMPPVEHGDG